MVPEPMGCLYSKSGAMTTIEDLFDPADLPVGQSNLYAMGMGGGSGQDILYHPPGQFPGVLVFFQNDAHLAAGMNIFP